MSDVGSPAAGGSSAGRAAKLPGSPLVFGGSFNPPHVGHFIACRAAAEALGFERVRLMVAGQSPFKGTRESDAPAEARLEMVRLAIAGDPLFEVDDRECRRDGPSYTLTTARELVGERPFAPGPVWWLIGADLLSGLPRWHESAALLAGEVAQLVVMRRGGFVIDWEALPEQVRHLRRWTVDVPEVEMSATMIRQRVREGRSIRYMVPEPVGQLIEQRRLYR